MKTKFLILLIAISFFLPGCLGIGSSTPSSSSTTNNATTNLYETNDFSISIPLEWETIERKNFTSNVPSEAIVAFRNNIKSEIFTTNVVVSNTNVTEGMTSSDIAKSSIEKAKTSLISFEELSSDTSSINYKDTPVETTIIEFQGKKSATDPIINFKQLYVVNNGLGFIVTAAYPQSEDETVVKYIDEMLNSFTLK